MINERDFILGLNSIDEEKYRNIDLDRIILYAVSLLEEKNIEPTFDNIVVTTFKLFPVKFALIGFAEFPDGKRIHDCLWHCTYKTKKWLIGNAKSGYHMSDKGKVILDDIKKVFSGLTKPPEREDIKIKAARKQSHFIKVVESSVAFRKYVENRKEDISEKELREALIGTGTTSEERLRKNLELLLKYAQQLNKKNVVDFLNFLSEKLTTK